MSGVTVLLIGGPTTVIELGGLRLLTDPTFDPPGRYPIGQRALVKTTGPALSEEQVGHVDAVLLSHDQHADNLDTSGRALVAACPVVLTTRSATDRLGSPCTTLACWEQIDLPRPDGRPLHVTGVPAQHGPDGTEHLTGEVTGFVLSGEDLPTVYVSGDNASLDVVRQVVARCGPIDVALLFAGAARTPLIDGPLTLTSTDAAEAARILDARHVVPAHTEGWEHFTEGPGMFEEAFTRGGLRDRLVAIAPGERATLCGDDETGAGTA